MTWQIEHEFQLGDHVTHTLDSNISGYISGIDASEIVHIGNKSVLKEHLKLSTDPTEYGWHNASEFERREKLQELGVPDMYIDHSWRDIVSKTK